MPIVSVSKSTKESAATAKAKKPMTDGALINRLHDLREAKRDLEAQASILSAEFEGLQQELMDRMQAAGVDKMAGSKATVSISKQIVASEVDWDKFWQYVFKNKASHLLQRRVADAAYRELLATLPKGKQVPGVTPFERKTLSLRAVSNPT